MLIPRAEPLPQAEHYAQAFSEVNQEMQTQGGLRFYLANRALMVTLDETLAAQDQRLAFYGLRFVDSSLNFDDEESYDACYAYINGYMAASEAGDKAFVQPHTFHDRLSSLDQWFQQERSFVKADSLDRMGDERSIIEQFGVYGLRQLGPVASSVLEDWAHEAYPERQRYARAFSLGAGALIACGILHQRTVNYEMASQIEIESSFDDELRQLLEGGRS